MAALINPVARGAEHAHRAARGGAGFEPVGGEDPDLEQGRPQLERLPSGNKWEVPYVQGLNPADIKRDFIFKVYAILGVQLAFTTAVICVFVFNDHLRAFSLGVLQSGVFGWFQLFTLLPLICAMPFYKDKYPTNFLLLFAFTLVIALGMAFTCAAYYTFGYGSVILSAAATTAVVFVGLSLYVRFSGQDFSFLGGFLFAAIWANIVLGLLAMLFGWSFGLWITNVFGVFIFVGYIIYDTDQIVNRVSLADCDTGTAIWGALELYLDIVNLFMYLLSLFSSND